MAVWFGHTQTLTSISKSVSTVASGILGLEANLATFMHKVVYYDKFFQRVQGSLPPEVVTTASRLFARCYEYRDEIRDELESSLAYVADAGRWVIGMEDWHSKMEKRLAQISELVLLANSLLAEYTLTGRWGADGAKEQLGAYLRGISDSVVLHHPRDERAPGSKSSVMTARASAPPSAHGNRTAGNQAGHGMGSGGTEPSMEEATAVSKSNSSVETSDDSGEAVGIGTNGNGDGSPMEAVEPTDDGEDDELLNPFARSYQPPVSIESSLASLRGDSDNGSVYYNAIEQQQQPQSQSQSLSPSQFLEDDDDEPDSPVSLGEYECLEIESIPQYVAFKPSAMSRKRRLKQRYGNLFIPTSEPVATTLKSPRHKVTSPRSQKPPNQTAPVPQDTTVTDKARQRQRLMDLTYSYDFQREIDYNPFASPGMPSEPGVTAPNDPPPLQLSVPTVKEDEEEDLVLDMSEQMYSYDPPSVDNVPFELRRDSDPSAGSSRGAQDRTETQPIAEVDASFEDELDRLDRDEDDTSEQRIEYPTLHELIHNRSSEVEPAELEAA